MERTRLTLGRLADVEEDLAAVRALAQESFRGVPFDPREELARPWARVWVAREGRLAPPVGFLSAWHVADELHVLNVATHPALRRRGVATALLEHALGYAAEHRVRIVLLEVRRSNRAAIRLYRRLAFHAMGVRPGYYADNQEDAIEMVLVIDPQTGQIQPGRDEISLADLPICPPR